MTALPDWMIIMQALLPPVIALGAGMIAFLQWRTAHQKVVLDLFDRRLKAVDGIKASLQPIFAHGRITPATDIVKIYNLMHEAQYVFGSDVMTFLARYKRVVGNIQVASSYSDSLSNPQYQTGVDMLHAGMLEMTKFHGEFDTLCARYMKMDQKLVRWPWQILISWIDRVRP